MPILKLPFTLLSNRALTHDVFELVFQPTEFLSPKAGEYVVFTISPGVKRAYSIAFRRDDGALGFIVKRVEGGKGSPVLCDMNTGDSIEGMGPMGHFTLKENNVAKCFLGTGTGFAPLYFQLMQCNELGFTAPMELVFWVREARDLFYTEEIAILSGKFPQFHYTPYVSREDVTGLHRGYVTEFLTPGIVKKYEEFYLCGSPAMVSSARQKLQVLGVAENHIFFEQY